MANGKVTLQMLSEIMSSTTGRTKTSTEQFTRCFFSTIKEALTRDNIVKIKGFGTFKMVVVNSRESINVNTGERVSIAEYNKISFTPEKNLKERINRPFAQFDTITIEDEDLEILEDSISSAKKTPKQTPLSETTTEAKPTEEDFDVKDTNSSENIDNTVANDTINADTEEEIINNDIQDVSTTEVSQPIELDTPTNDGTQKRNHKHVILFTVLSLLIAVAAYMVGYMQLFNFDIKKLLATTETTSPKTNKANSDKTKDIDTQEKLAQDTLQADLPQKNIPTEANNYPQIADGKYYIVGIKTYRKIKSDYNIKRYCLQIYGNTEILPYVLLINNIDNPDNVAVGKIIKFPLLIEK